MRLPTIREKVRAADLAFDDDGSVFESRGAEADCVGNFPGPARAALTDSNMAAWTTGAVWPLKPFHRDVAQIAVGEVGLIGGLHAAFCIAERIWLMVWRCCRRADL